MLRSSLLALTGTTLVAGLLVGAMAIVSGTEPRSALASSSLQEQTTLTVRAVRPGDLLLVAGNLVRVADKRLVENGRFRLRATSPVIGDDRKRLIGVYSPRKVVFVEARDVPVNAVQMVKSTSPSPAPTVSPLSP